MTTRPSRSRAIRHHERMDIALEDYRAGCDAAIQSKLRMVLLGRGRRRPATTTPSRVPVPLKYHWCGMPATAPFHQADVRTPPTAAATRPWPPRSPRLTASFALGPSSSPYEWSAPSAFPRACPYRRDLAKAGRIRRSRSARPPTSVPAVAGRAARQRRDRSSPACPAHRRRIVGLPSSVRGCAFT